MNQNNIATIVVVVIIVLAVAWLIYGCVENSSVSSEVAQGKEGFMDVGPFNPLPWRYYRTGYRPYYAPRVFERPYAVNSSYNGTFMNYLYDMYGDCPYGSWVIDDTTGSVVCSSTRMPASSFDRNAYCPRDGIWVKMANGKYQCTSTGDIRTQDYGLLYTGHGPYYYLRT